MSSAETMTTLEDKFFSAFERGDSEAIAECYSPEMRVWSNVQPQDITGSEHIAGLKAHFFARYTDRKFTNIRTDPIQDGFVRQHVVTGLLDGAPVHIPMCVICRIKHGKMVRIDEYLSFAPPPKP